MLNLKENPQVVRGELLGLWSQRAGGVPGLLSHYSLWGLGYRFRA